jgi:hypothetical protein
LSLDSLEFVQSDFPVPESRYGGDEAEQILGVDCYTNADPRYVGIGRNARWKAHGEEKDEGCDWGLLFK